MHRCRAGPRDSGFGGLGQDIDHHRCADPDFGIIPGRRRDPVDLARVLGVEFKRVCLDIRLVDLGPHGFDARILGIGDPHADAVGILFFLRIVTRARTCIAFPFVRDRRVIRQRVHVVDVILRRLVVVVAELLLPRLFGDFTCQRSGDGHGRADQLGFERHVAALVDLGETHLRFDDGTAKMQRARPDEREGAASATAPGRSGKQIARILRDDRHVTAVHGVGAAGDKRVNLGLHIGDRDGTSEPDVACGSDHGPRSDQRVRRVLGRQGDAVGHDGGIGGKGGNSGIRAEYPAEIRGEREAECLVRNLILPGLVRRRLFAQPFFILFLPVGGQLIRQVDLAALLAVFAFVLGRVGIVRCRLGLVLVLDPFRPGAGSRDRISARLGGDAQVAERQFRRTPASFERSEDVFGLGGCDGGNGGTVGKDDPGPQANRDLSGLRPGATEGEQPRGVLGVERREIADDQRIAVVHDGAGVAAIIDDREAAVERHRFRRPERLGDDHALHVVRGRGVDTGEVDRAGIGKNAETGRGIRIEAQILHRATDPDGAHGPLFILARIVTLFLRYIVAGDIVGQPVDRHGRWRVDIVLFFGRNAFFDRDVTQGDQPAFVLGLQRHSGTRPQLGVVRDLGDRIELGGVNADVDREPDTGLTLGPVEDVPVLLIHLQRRIGEEVTGKQRLAVVDGLEPERGVIQRVLNVGQRVGGKRIRRAHGQVGGGQGSDRRFHPCGDGRPDEPV